MSTADGMPGCGLRASEPPAPVTDDAAGRAGRLLRWYPAAWRARYGEEFTELLIADIRERPRSAARTRDVVRGGIVARLADAGLARPSGTAAGSGARDRQVRASLVSLGCAVAVFLGFGAALWSQLTIGWRWGAPASGTATLATALAAFPAAELAWMAVSPLALAAAVTAAATLVRRAEFPPRLLAFEARLGTVACAVMAVFLAGCSCWVATGGQRSLFHAGLIDVAGVTMMALALGIAQQATRTARIGLTFAER